jgi:hypothetical protein
VTQEVEAPVYEMEGDFIPVKEEEPAHRDVETIILDPRIMSQDTHQNSDQDSLYEDDGR